MDPHGSSSRQVAGTDFIHKGTRCLHQGVTRFLDGGNAGWSLLRSALPRAISRHGL
jgi:hypothetical protein